MPTRPRTFRPKYAARRCCIWDRPVCCTRGCDMLNNDCCTVYRQVYDAGARSDRYERYVLPAVCWQDMRYGLSDRELRDNGRQSGAFSTVHYPLSDFAPELAWRSVRARGLSSTGRGGQREGKPHLHIEMDTDPRPLPSSRNASTL